MGYKSIICKVEKFGTLTHFFKGLVKLKEKLNVVKSYNRYCISQKVKKLSSDNRKHFYALLPIEFFQL